MDCRTARILAELRGPHGAEIASIDEAELQNHLLNCAECRALIVPRLEFDRGMARAMIDVPVPAGLSARILENLVHDRAGWYRRRFWQFTAAAASILLVIGFSLRWVEHPRGDLNVADLVVDVEHQLHNRPAAAKAWLDREGIAFEPRVPFDYNWLLAYGPRELMGKMVPSLTFVNPDKRVNATVFIIRGNQFGIDKLREDTYSCHNSADYQVQLIEDAPRRQWYVIVYNGDLSEVLLKSLQAS